VSSCFCIWTWPIAREQGRLRNLAELQHAIR
jgi:hypothetical protein